MKNYCQVMLSSKSLNLRVLGYPNKKSEQHKNLYAIFDFIGQYFFKNDVLDVFSELGNRVMLENELRSFQAFLILQLSDESEVQKESKNSFKN
jgi:hypothetical protein